MTLRMLRGAEAVLARHSRALPQPDQLCGPFSATVALAALSPDPADVVELALAAGTHVLAGDHADRLTAAWRPHATITTAGEGIDVVRHHRRRRDLHPDLALLMSTSGSTGVCAAVVGVTLGRWPDQKAPRPATRPAAAIAPPSARSRRRRRGERGLRTGHLGAPGQDRAGSGRWCGIRLGVLEA